MKLLHYWQGVALSAILEDSAFVPIDCGCYLDRMAKEFITIEGVAIELRKVQDQDYISLSNMAGIKSDEGKAVIVNNWIRTVDTLEFMRAWENIHNPDFNVLEFDNIRSQAGANSFTISPKKWVDQTAAIGLFVKLGKYGGVWGHPDLAYHFGMWLQPRFALLVIKEFRALEANRETRLLSKINQPLTTEEIKKQLTAANVPVRQHWTQYASEMDMLNVVVFGRTAKEFREAEPDKAQKGNQRDFASPLQKLILSNLEAINGLLIAANVNQARRFDMLTKEAQRQTGILGTDKRLD